MKARRSLLLLVVVAAAFGLGGASPAQAADPVVPEVLAPEVVEPSDNNPLSGTTGKLVGGAAVFVAAALAVVALSSLLPKEESTLTTVLRPYTEDVGPDTDDGSRLQSRLVRRVVGVIESYATRQGVLAGVERALARGDVPFRAAEALFVYGACVALVVLLALVVAPAFLLALLLTFVAVAAPPAGLSYLGGRRRRAFLAQLPDTLQLLSGSLRAGYSLMQGVGAVADEVADPMAKELHRVLAESRLGRPVEESLEDMAERMDSPDFAWAVIAIRIQREVGGNLAELLSTVAETMVSRQRLRREVQALTAEGRVSAFVLALLPVGIGGAVWTINRPYIQVLFEERLGQYLLGGSFLLLALGFWWMKKTIQIDI